jgi:hypothetical protein
MHMPVDSALSAVVVLREIQSLFVAMEHWSCGHRGFAVEMFFKNNCSAIDTVILGSTLTLEEIVRSQCVKPFHIG